MMRRRLAGGAFALAVAVPAVALAQAGSRQTATLTFDQQRPGGGTGSSLAIDYMNPDDPEAKAPAVQKVVIEFPPGTAIDDSVPERCDASDQELIATGRGACPEGSVLGGGELDVDTGIEGPGRILASKVTMFNNDDQLILFLESTTNPRRLVTRGRIEGTTLTTEVPPTPGGPPDGIAAIKRVRLRVDPYPNGRGDYLRTPPSCPPGGAWTTSLTFTYRDGQSQALTSASPCAQDPAAPLAPPRQPDPAPGPGSSPRDTLAPAIRLRGSRRTRCARRSFTIRVNVRESGSGLRRVALWRDGRRVLVTSRARFAKRIRVRRRLTVVATDNAGNRSVRRLRFRRCR